MKSDASAIEDHLAAMEAADTTTDEGAHESFAHAMSAIGRIDEHMGAQHLAIKRHLSLEEDLVARLDVWIKRLVAGLTKIASQLNASFSVTVGTGLSVTMNFGPFHRV
jgi:hypothetical protein